MGEITSAFSRMAKPTPVGLNEKKTTIFRWSYVHCVMKKAKLTLPKGEENHRFHRAELEHWIEWRQQVPRGKIEQIQSVQGQRDRNVVDDGDVDVATIGAEIERKM